MNRVYSLNSLMAPDNNSGLIAQQKQIYDPHASPPNISLAQKHGLAVRVCKQQEGPDKSEKCCCCGLSINNVALPITTDLRFIAHLGITFPLYFQFIKKCAVLLVFQLLLSSLYNFYINASGKNCEKYSSFVCSLSIVNVFGESEFERSMESLGNFITLIVMIILIELFKVHQQIAIYGYQKHKITPSDFTIQIGGFSPTTPSPKLFFKKYLDQVDIIGVYLLLDMENYSQKYKTKLNLINQINNLKCRERKLEINDELILQKQRCQEQLVKINSELDDIDAKLQQFIYVTKEKVQEEQLKIEHIRQFFQENGSVIKYSGKLLVTFNNSADAQKLINIFTFHNFEHLYYWLYRRGILKEFCINRLERFQFNGHIIRLKRAAEPSDIIWMNVGSTKINQNILISCIVVVILFLSGLTLSFFKQFIKRQTQSFDAYLGTGISLLVSTVVALTNTLLGIVIRKFAGLETHKKQTNYFISVGGRLSYLYFINMVVTTLISNLLIRSSESTLPHYRLVEMTNDFFFLFLTNTYLSSIFNYFDIVWFWRLWKRHQIVQQGEYCSLSQREVNQLFEGHPVDMALRYANVLKLMFFTGAVSPLLPIGVPLGILGLLILYWVDKLLLLRRYVCKNYLDQQLANSMMDILSQYTIFFSLGNLLVMLCLDDDKLFRSEIEFDSNLIVSLTGVFLSVIYRYGFTLANFRKIYHSLFQIKVPKKKINGTYDTYKTQFSETYEQYHPVLQEGQMQESPRLLENIESKIQQIQ